MTKGGSNVVNLTDAGPREARQEHHGPVVFEERSASEGRSMRARRLSSIEVMERNGTITPSMRRAADEFFTHFSQAGLGSRYSTINLFRVAGGSGNYSEAQAHHLHECRKAMDSVGKGLAASILWDVVGLNCTVKAWAGSRVVPIRPEVAMGILIAALDRLSEHWKL